MKLHHLGYACKDIQESLEYLRKLYKVKNTSPCIYDKNQDANLCLVDVEDSIPIELVSGEKVKSFVDKGISIYHVCYECEDLQMEIEKYRSEGAIVISKPVPAELFGGSLVTFLNTDMGIIELLEKGHHVGTLQDDTYSSMDKSTTKEKMVISASFTVEPVKEYLMYLNYKLSFNLDIIITPYNQVFQQLLSPNSILRQNKDGFNVTLFKFEDWIHYLDPESIDIKKEFEKNTLDFINAIRSYMRSNAAKNIIMFCPLSPKYKADDFTSKLCDNLEEKIVNSLSSVSNLHFIRSFEIFDKYKQEKYFNYYSNKLAHIPYNEEFFAALSIMIMRKIQSIKGYPYKVIVLDCDDTLWDGICGEIGYEKIGLSEERIFLHEFILRQAEAGMLICLCSKNNEADVMEVFNKRHDMRIKLEHLADWMINWETKSTNLRRLAQKLKLGLDSFIFVDNNPYECAEVTSKIPEVTLLQLPVDKKDIPAFLEKAWIFDHNKVTTEDKNRNIYYKQNIEREKYREKTLTFKEFIKGLDINITIRPIISDEVERASELTKRTNQFNLSAKKRTSHEIEELLKQEYRCYVVYVKDRFGDYGLVGVIIFSHIKEFIVDTFLLSCRVLGRGVEAKMLLNIGETARQSGFDEILFEYLDTGKNILAYNFLCNSCSSKRYDNNSSTLIRINTLDACKISTNYFDEDNSSTTNNNLNTIQISKSINNLFQEKLKVLQEIDSPKKLLKALDIKSELTYSGRNNQYLIDSEQSIEDKLKLLFKEVLQIKTIGKDDNFFLLGGDSLSAVKLASRVYSAFGVELLINDLFNSPTVSKLKDIITKGINLGEKTKKEIPELDEFLKRNPMEIKDMYPLSFSQEALWQYEQIFPDSWIYNMPLALYTKGVLNLAALNYAFNKLIKQHEALRTVFTQKHGIPYQIIKDNLTIDIQIENREESKIEEIEELIRTEETVKFDLSNGPLIRVRVIRLNDEENLILLTIHHIIFDGWSYSILFKDISTFYNEYITRSFKPIQPLPLRFVDYITWEREFVNSKKIKHQIEYWKKQLYGLKLHELPPDKIISDKTHNGLYFPIMLEDKLVNKIHKLCLEFNVSLFTMLITIFDILIFSLINHDDVAVGTIIAKRKSQSLENIIGFLINALVIRSDLSNNPPFKDILTRNRKVILEALDNGDAYFGDVINAAASVIPKDKNNPFYHAMFIFQNTPNNDLRLDGLTINKHHEGYNIARSDLILELEEKHNKVYGGFYYNNNYFKTDTINQFALRFMNILKNVTNNPEIRIDIISDSKFSSK